MESKEIWALRKNDALKCWSFKKKKKFIKCSNEEEADKMGNFKPDLWYEFHADLMSDFFESRSAAIMHFIVEHPGEELLEDVGRPQTILVVR